MRASRLIAPLLLVLVASVGAGSGVAGESRGLPVSVSREVSFASARADDAHPFGYPPGHYCVQFCPGIGRRRGLQTEIDRLHRGGARSLVLIEAGCPT